MLFQMTVMVDNDVDDAAANVLIERGHIVHKVRDLKMHQDPDIELVSRVNDWRAVVMTHNRRDFRNLLPTIAPPGHRRGFRRAGVIFLTGRQQRAAARLVTWLDEIETEYRKWQQHGGYQFTVEVGDTYFRILR